MLTLRVARTDCPHLGQTSFRVLLGPLPSGIVSAPVCCAPRLPCGSWAAGWPTRSGFRSILLKVYLQPGFPPAWCSIRTARRERRSGPAVHPPPHLGGGAVAVAPRLALHRDDGHRQRLSGKDVRVECVIDVFQLAHGPAHFGSLFRGSFFP